MHLVNYRLSSRSIADLELRSASANSRLVNARFAYAPNSDQLYNINSPRTPSKL